MSETYVDAVLDGATLWTDIDDWVDRWHEGPSTLELHDFLGMDWEEYRLWAEQPAALRFILAAREFEQPVADVLSFSTEAIAARGLSDEDARTVKQWLQRTGRLAT
jgi:hypothetical protein